MRAQRLGIDNVRGHVAFLASPAVDLVHLVEVDFGSLM
jgi:hypothetical protein